LGDRHHKLAAAVEFIHTATLLHDDVVDGSDLRRGRAAANVIWGNGPSVLVGDFLFSRAFELMVEVGSLPVLRLLSHASAVIAEGEVAQTTAQRVVETTEDRYLEIISAKTAALFAAAAQIAAVVADADPATEEALGAFGRNLGIAFQLVDDAIDYVSDSAVMGKTAGDDFREGKVTLPIILAYARGDAEARRFWRRAVTGRANGADALAEAVGRLNATGAIADTLARARLYGSRATDALALMPPSAAAAALTETVEFAVSRAY
jgi:octaprenyl-diphosphate synthase